MKMQVRPIVHDLRIKTIHSKIFRTHGVNAAICISINLMCYIHNDVNFAKSVGRCDLKRSI